MPAAKLFLIMAICACTTTWTYKVVVKPKRKTPKRIVFMVDVSGSMEGDKLSRAMSAWSAFAASSTDEAEILVVKFGTTYEQYPKGWIKMPDAKELDAAVQWSGRAVPNQGTNFGVALRWIVQAHMNHHPREIVVVTDGQFYTDRDASLKKTIKDHNAHVSFVGIGAPDRGSGWNTMKTLATASGGSFINIVGKEEKSDEDDNGAQ